MSQARERDGASALYRLRHSAAHVMAEAVLARFPAAKLAIGPPIADGFYYDFDLGLDTSGRPRTFSEGDVEAIEARLKELLREPATFERSTMSIAEARRFFAEQPYKLELIEELAAGRLDENGEPTTEPQEAVGIYRHRDFVDLCRGPHVAETSQIPADGVKLVRSAGAYWRGDEARPQLQRLYGTAWPDAASLAAHLERLEAIRLRDHRRLGRELDLFSANDEIGAGLILWHPRGGLIRKVAEDYWNDMHEQGGYGFVFTPHIGKGDLWRTSGHLDFYADDMYAPLEIEGQAYYLKPMNCPFHVHIYKSQTRSYRDLPLRYAEKGTVYRYERSGVLHGLLRVRGFTQDDAHHFCRPDQMADELGFALNFSLEMLRAFGLTEFRAYLSTRPEKFVGDAAQWEAAEVGLREVLATADMPFQVDVGGGVFYGPKIDLAIEDALGREWQISTIQFDFNLPERFGMVYIGPDGREHRPLMLHRALLGSMERFFGILIEHYGGAFPVWLAPEQAIVLTIADRHRDYAERVAAELKAHGVRATVDWSSDRVSKKIQVAQQQKIPYMLVVGDREAAAGTASWRLRTGEDRGPLPIDAIAAEMRRAIDARADL